MEHPPGEEAQVDYFQGPPTFDEAQGRWRRPWIFRMTLSCSKHGYEEQSLNYPALPGIQPMHDITDPRSSVASIGWNTGWLSGWPFHDEHSGMARCGRNGTATYPHESG